MSEMLGSCSEIIFVGHFVGLANKIASHNLFPSEVIRDYNYPPPIFILYWCIDSQTDPQVSLSLILHGFTWIRRVFRLTMMDHGRCVMLFKNPTCFPSAIIRAERAWKRSKTIGIQVPSHLSLHLAKNTDPDVNKVATRINDNCAINP